MAKTYIYKPKGRAKEYSPLAFNVMLGCNHGCVYCYNNTRFKNDHIVPRKIDIVTFERELAENKYNEQVMLSFIGDYFGDNGDSQFVALRNQILRLLGKYDIPVAILSKAGLLIEHYLDSILSIPRVKVGASLTFADDISSLQFEPGAAVFSDRIKMLTITRQVGIKTFVSLEPYFDNDMLKIILRRTEGIVDHYLWGKINHYDFDFVKYKTDEEWEQASLLGFDLLKRYSGNFYVKQSLQKYLSGFLTTKEKEKYFINHYNVGEKNAN